MMIKIDMKVYNVLLIELKLQMNLQGISRFTRNHIPGIIHNDYKHNFLYIIKLTDYREKIKTMQCLNVALTRQRKVL